MKPKLTEWARDRIKEDADLIMQLHLEIEEQDCRVAAQNFLLGGNDVATLIKVPYHARSSRLSVNVDARGTIEAETLPAELSELFVEVMEGQ